MIRFTSYVIDNKIEKVGEGWTLKRIVLFEFSNYEIRLVLRLHWSRRPGIERKTVRFFKAKSELFKHADRRFGKWHAVYQKSF